MPLVFGLGLMGLLLGFLTGVTSEAMVKPMFTLLFAFVGGSVFVLLSKLTVGDRSLAGKMLSALSLCCLVGLVAGILTNQHRWLSPNISEAQKHFKGVNDAYVNAAPVSEGDKIDQEKQAKLITADQAYAELYSAYNRLFLQINHDETDRKPQ